jgi:NAD(P)-dependent dehydrogenase (short-subunit alcohol dehydrogenase family)
MSSRPEKPVAVVTGAARGLGLAFARRLAAGGAHVVCVDKESPDGVVRSIRGDGGEAVGHICDVSEAAEVRQLGDLLREEHGSCDILVNNAGIYPFQSFDEIEFDDWRAVMTVNLDSMFHTCKAFVPGMRSKGWGRVVNMASDVFGGVLTGVTHYTASKGAVIGFTRALATELGPFGVTVNAIAPGLVRTPGTLARQHPGAAGEPEEFAEFAKGCAIPRAGRPEDVSGILAFLVSDDAAYLTGQTLWVDGGRIRS